MTITINKHTGTYETLQRELTDSEGNVTTEDYESEILEVVTTIASDDSKKVKAARLRAEILTRDTDFAHSVEVTE